MSPTRKKLTVAAAATPTMADLARLAGVSKITISRALADSPLVARKTRERLQALAHQQGYRLNVSARNLRLRRSKTVAVIVEMQPSSNRTMWDPYPLALLGGISQELTSAGYSVLLTTRQGIANATIQTADGLILLGQGERGKAESQYERLGLPMVVWGAESTDDRHVVVGSDNQQGGASVAARFLSLGRRHPVFIGNVEHPEMAQRLQGFAAELAKQQLEPTVMPPAGWTLEAGAKVVRSLARRKLKFDAIFAGSDLLAMGAIRALVELGIGVPNDVSVVGYDNTPHGAGFLPPLSSVEQDWQEGGVLLARKVLALIDGNPAPSQMLPARLIVRDT